MRKNLFISLLIFLVSQAGVEAAEAPKLASAVPENAVAAIFIRDLPELAGGKAWMSSLSEAFDGELAIVLLDVPKEKRVPPFIVLGEVNPQNFRRFLDARLKPILRRNLGKVEFVPSEGIVEIIVNDSPTAFYAVKGDVLSFSLERKVVSDFVSKPVPEEKSLRGNPLFTKLAARIVPGSRSTCFVNVKRIFEIFGHKIPARTRDVLKAAGILDIESWGACDRMVDGAYTGSFSLITSGKPSGFLVFAAQRPAPITTARLIPGDYSLYARFRFVSFTEAWRELTKTIGQVSWGEAEEGISDFLEGFREATGLDFEKDFLDSLGGEISVAAAVPESIRIPDGIALLEVRNRRKIESVLAKIIPPEAGETQEYKDVTIRTINLGPTTAAYAFLDNYLVFGTSDATLKSVVDTAAGGGSLTENPAFQKALSHLGEGGHMFYLDVGSGLPVMLSAISQAVEATGRLEVEPEEETIPDPPKWEVIAKLLISPLLADSVLAFTTFGDDESVTFRGSSTITGTYNWMATSSILAGMLLPAMSRARESARRAACMSNLRQLALGEHMYAQDHDGKFSENLSDLYPDYIASLGVFTCPSAAGPGQWITTKEDIDSLSSYVLRKGLSRASPTDAVLIYEDPSNHRGDGGNVAYVDGHVRWLSAAELEEIAETEEEQEETPSELEYEGQAFYYCTNCKAEFEASLLAVPPIACLSCGQLTAAHARKFACRGCGEVFVGYIQKFDPGTKALIEARQRGEDVPDEQIGSILVSKADQIDWLDASSREAVQLIERVVCPDCRKLPARLGPVFPERRKE